MLVKGSLIKRISVIPKQPLVGGENQRTPTAQLLIPITVYATSGQTQIFMPPKHT